MKKGKTSSDGEKVCEIMTVLGEDDDEWYCKDFVGDEHKK